MIPAVVRRTLGPILYGVRSAGWRLRRLLSDRVTVRTPQGRITVSSRDQTIGRGIYLLRHHEYDLTTRVVDLLRRLDPHRFRGRGAVLDVGANVGVIGIGLVLNGHFARCVSVEPEPLNFSLLQHNVRQNGLEGRVTCVQTAASEAPGQLDFELSETNYGDHRVRVGAGTDGERYGESGRKVIRVPAAPLDAVLDDLPADVVRSVELVWIDVQGFELSVLRGGGAFFSRKIPTVIEVWPYGLRRAGASPSALAEAVAAHWTHYYDLDDPELTRHPVGGLAELMRRLDAGGVDNRNILLV